MIIAFDLDDTLYDEKTFVKSGFKQVAAYLYDTYRVPLNESQALMMDFLEKSGRGSIFNQVLLHYGLYSKKNVRKCISVYRMHKPDIRLYNEADKCLERFNGNSVYIVTDGNKIVQQNKITALNLQRRVKYSFITYRYGRKHSKPSPHCFIKLCEREKATPEEIVYIGDNPNKDFVGIKPLGFKTIRVLTGQYKNLNKSKRFEADCTINSLEELTPDYLKKMFG